MPIRDTPPSDRPGAAAKTDGARAEGQRSDGQRSDGERAPGAGTGESFAARDWLTQATGEMRDSFARNRRVISFSEYVTLFSAEPVRQLRSAAQYLRDVFDHFGTEPVRTPRGPMTRWRLI